MLGKTNQSAKLRTGPGEKFDFIDELEPGYPLVIRDDPYKGWLPVTARAQGRRLVDQSGWIAARLVNIDKPKPPPEPEFSPWPWIIASVVLVAGLAFIILPAILSN